MTWGDALMRRLITGVAALGAAVKHAADIASGGLDAMVVEVEE
jgi:hypothetical protein